MRSAPISTGSARRLLAAFIWIAAGCRAGARATLPASLGPLVDAGSDADAAGGRADVDAAPPREPWQPPCKAITNVWAKSSATGACRHYADSCTLPIDTAVQTLDEQSCERTTSSCGHADTEVHEPYPNDCNMRICGPDGKWGVTIVGCHPQPFRFVDGTLLLQNLGDGGVLLGFVDGGTRIVMPPFSIPLDAPAPTDKNSD
ncbi:MAG: hypothetical protein ACRELY_00065 [Polyangiaceae bacterium]